MKPGQPLPRRTRLRAKRWGLNRTQQGLNRRTVLVGTRGGRARPDEPLAHWCTFAIAGVCQGRAVHRHHLAGRVGPGADAAGNTADVCAACHAHAHGHPDEAYARGWLRHRAWQCEECQAPWQAIGDQCRRCGNRTRVPTTEADDADRP